MKTIERIYAAGIFTIFIGIIFHAPLSVGLGTLFPDYIFLIKSWKEILMVPLAVVAVVAVTKRYMWRELTDDVVFRLIIAYVTLHGVMTILLYKGLTVTLAGLAIDLRYVLFFGLVYVFLRLWPHYRLKLIIASALGALVVVGFGVLQLFLPADSLKYIGYSSQTIAPYLTVDQNHDYIRINSTLRGPNSVGAYMVIVLTMMASLLLLQKQRLNTVVRRSSFAAMGIASLIVLWISYSRSALLAAVTGVVIVLTTVFGRRLSRRSVVVSGLVVVILIVGLAFIRSSSFVANVILHDNPSTGAVITSNDGHLSSLQHGVKRLIHQPFGTGVGSTGSASLYGEHDMIIENQYLFVAHETGWLGLGLFLAIFGLILLRLWHRRKEWLSLALFASGIGLALIGILLPVWADDTVSIIWWGLAGVALASGKMISDSSQKKGKKS